MGAAEGKQQQQERGLPGGWKPGDVAYYAAASHTLPSKDKLKYGDRGVIVGASMVNDGDDDQRVAVKFPGNNEAIACFLDALAAMQPPEAFGDNWHVGDMALFTGQPRPQLGIKAGMSCTVVGPAPGEERGVAVMFPGHTVPIVTTSITHHQETCLSCGWCGGGSKEKVFEVNDAGEMVEPLRRDQINFKMN